MHATIIGAKAVGPWRLSLTFADGTFGIADLESWMRGRGGLFTALHDPAYFAAVRVNPAVGTVEWPNGVDADPDLLYDLATGQASAN